MKIISTELADDVKYAMGWERLRSFHKAASLTVDDAAQTRYRELATKLRALIEKEGVSVVVAFMSGVKVIETLVADALTQVPEPATTTFSYDDNPKNAN